MLSRMSTAGSSRLSLVFSSLGHGYVHVFSVYFYLVVLPLEREWRLPYSDLIELWTVGSLLIGALALPLGWIADRWSATGMMIVFFVGLGGAAIACGLAPSPFWLWVGLCLLGAFAAIYHPVGLPWLVRTSRSRGKALGINGIFGSMGVAAAGLVAGTLIDLAGWRVAFVVPGAVVIATGLVMWGCVRTGLVSDGTGADAGPAAAPASRGDRRRAFGVLLVTMFGGAIIYQSTLAVLPKLFEVRLGDLVGHGTFGVGALVAVAYGLAGLSQIAAGHLADRYPLKRVYVIAIACQAPLLWAAAHVGGLPLVPIATLMIIANTASLPAENILLAETAPRRQSAAFGVKFVLSFGAAPLAIRIVAFATEHPAGLFWLFVALAVTSAAVTIAALFLPARAPASAIPA
jgi:MFS family permease